MRPAAHLHVQGGPGPVRDQEISGTEQSQPGEYATWWFREPFQTVIQKKNF